MKLIKTENAAGQVLCHDITQIIPGVSKGPVFRKGHVITKDDIPVLLSVGKDNIYVWEADSNMIHEDDAAKILYDLCRSENMHPSEIKEGKIEAVADIDGLLKIDREKLRAINSHGEMMIASRHGDFPIKAGEVIAGMRIIPLMIERGKMESLKEKISGRSVFRILPFSVKKVGIVATGNEVFYHRIEDKFTPVVKAKVEEYGGEVISQKVSSDDPEMEIRLINELLDVGAELILCTGGMSVDPDDKTPYAIRRASDKVITYGAPVLPGAMFMLAYKGNVPVVGLPGCVMHSRRTIFDLILPRLMANDVIEREDFETLGEGGLCLNCKTCTFPDCGFGK